MDAVTYITFTQEQLNKTLQAVTDRAIQAYKRETELGQLLSVKEVAEYLRVNPRTVIAKIERGELKPACRNPYRISKYTLTTLEEREAVGPAS